MNSLSYQPCFHIRFNLLILFIIFWIIVIYGKGTYCQDGQLYKNDVWFDKRSDNGLIADNYVAGITPLFKSVLITKSMPKPGPRILFDETMFATIDRHALQAPASARNSIESLARYLTAPAKNDIEKVRSIYRWITENISYDVRAFRTGNDGDLSPERVLVSGSSVCSGYTRLFGKLASVAGIEVVEISGWAKGIGYEAGDSVDGPTNHAWNAVKIGDGWYLIDSTWGAGSSDGIQFIRQFDEHYFLTPPEQFIYDHLPEDPSWQLLEMSLSKAEFVRLPFVKSIFFKNGLRIDSHFQSVIQANHRLSIMLWIPLDIVLFASLIRDGQVLDKSLTFAQREENSLYKIDAEFPARADYILRIFIKHTKETGPYWQAIDYKVEVGERLAGFIGFPEISNDFQDRKVYLYTPKSGYLQSNATHQFRLKVPRAQQVAVIIGSNWFYLTKNGDFFEGNVPVQEGEIQVCAEFFNESNFKCLLNYTSF